jgi:DNA gyrase/topoisomerase IV subunit A
LSPRDCRESTRSASRARAIRSGGNGFINHNTEARLAPIAEEFLSEIEENTVDFVPNFDDSLTEPVVLPAKVPNLLINGSWGISVGMTTQIPPHNLGEVVDALVHLIENPDAPLEELLHYIKGPDFPTGGIILGREGIEEAYRTGEGKIKVRGVARIEDHSIIISEIPFQVRKSTLVEAIANKVRSGDIDEISDLRDESDREGIRIVVELKRGSNPQLVLQKLYKYTPLEWTFGANFLVIVDGNPRKLTLKELLFYFLAHRREVVRRRTQFRLNAAQERAHLLEGMLKAIEKRDEIIELISKSKDASHALEAPAKEISALRAASGRDLEDAAATLHRSRKPRAPPGVHRKNRKRSRSTRRFWPTRRSSMRSSRTSCSRSRRSTAIRAAPRSSLTSTKRRSVKKRSSPTQIF